MEGHKGDESGARKGGTGKIGRHWLHMGKYNKTHYQYNQ